MDFPQAGGHGLMVTSQKAIVVKPTRPSEVWFYINAPPVLRPFMPKFYMACPLIYAGAMFTPEKIRKITQKMYTDVVIMESLNATNDEFALDVKIGSIHWTKNTPPEIIEAHIKRNEKSLTKTHGFRLDGAFQNGGYALSKEDCRNFDIDQLNSAFMCISDATKILLISWINNLISVLQHVQLAIYGPSILISGTNKQPKFTLIDFAIHDPTTNPDLIEGLKSFQKFLYAHIDFCKKIEISIFDFDSDELSM